MAGSDEEAHVEHRTVAVPRAWSILSRSVEYTPINIVCLSDTHSMHRQLPILPRGDLLIVAGDFTRKGTRAEVKDFNDWLSSLDFATKIVIPGNHDTGVLTEFSDAKAAEWLSSATHYLADVTVEVHGLRIHGSSWLGRGKRRIPVGLDILITHDPPCGTLDNGYGDENLAEQLAELGSADAPRLHVFGHVHEARGVVADSALPTISINAAVANDGMVSTEIVAGATFIALPVRGSCCALCAAAFPDVVCASCRVCCCMECSLEYFDVPDWEHTWEDFHPDNSEHGFFASRRAVGDSVQSRSSNLRRTAGRTCLTGNRHGLDCVCGVCCTCACEAVCDCQCYCDS